jgi:hypothetical protein
VFSEVRDILKTNAGTTVPATPSIVEIILTGGKGDPTPLEVNAQQVIELSETEIAPKTIPGDPTAHSLLNDLTKCQARRKRGLDVLDLTLVLCAEHEAGSH